MDESAKSKGRAHVKGRDGRVFNSSDKKLFILVKKQKYIVKVISLG